jgi:phytoene synthase
MTNLLLYKKSCYSISKIITRNYSSSFFMGIQLMNRKFHNPIYAIYGFVRLADEIVDTFHDHDKSKLLDCFKNDTLVAIKEGISLNPILNAFQEVVHLYQIPMELIDSFLESMSMDLKDVVYDSESYNKYILGSAEVVGLMCLKVFTEGNNTNYLKLTPAAMRLGAAFQKINFLRDIQADFELLGRTYFPGVDIINLTENEKRNIENEIALDFEAGKVGIKLLPFGARAGVYVAYVYYFTLFKKIRTMAASRILKERIRVPNFQKYLLMIKSYFIHSLNLI